MKTLKGAEATRVSPSMAIVDDGGAAAPSSPMNRRNFLMNSVVSVASVASVTAVAAPTIAYPTAGQCSFPELVEQYQNVFERWKTQKEKDESERVFIDQELIAALGTAQRPNWEDEEARARFDVAWEEISKKLVDDDDGIWTDISGELFAVCGQIIAQPILSIVDLGIHAQAFALMESEYWTGDEHGGNARRIIDTICRFAGVEALPGFEVAPVVYDEDVEDDENEVAAREPEEEEEKDPVFAAIKAHQKAWAMESAAVDELAAVETAECAARENGTEGGADLKRRRRNIDRRVTRSQKRSITAWTDLMSVTPTTDIGKSAFIGYVRKQVEKCGMEREDLETLLETVHVMVTPRWLARMAKRETAAHASQNA